MNSISLPYIAQVTNPALGTDLQTINGTSFFQSLLSSLVSLGLVIGGVVFLFMLILGGIQYITSGGDKAQTEAARGRLTTAFIGLIILFGFFAIVGVTSCFFGIDLLQIRIGTFNVGFEDASLCGS